MRQYDFYIEIPQSVKEILSVLYKYGFDAYIVGGSVRDSYSGKKPNDFDITTNAKPAEMTEIFSPHFKVIETGIKHGTLTVVNKGYSVEVTTYRIDGEYTNNRKPESVVFTGNLFEDLKRRDFTINALVYTEKEGILDFFDGIDDINNKRIKCIGDPSNRFNEDALRILRAIRFSAKLDFDIETNTSNSIHALSHLLKNISGERIYSELSNFFSYDNVNRKSKLLVQYKDVFETALLSSFSTCDYENKCEVSQKVPADNDLRFKLFLSMISQDLFMLNKILSRLKVSNSFKKDTLVLYECINNSELLACESIFSAKKAVYKYGKDTALLCANVIYLINDNKNFLNFVEKIIYENLCTDIKSLDISGDDLIKNFNVSGQVVGDVLYELLMLVMKDEILNEKGLLIEKAKQIINTILN